jgi:hypothetical protein
MWDWKKVSGLVFLAMGLSNAHLVASSLAPAGGEKLTAGEQVSIAWKAGKNHPDNPNKIEISFSKDGGITWSGVGSGIPDTEVDNIYKWRVPADLTTQGRIRVCQSGPCTTQNVTKAEGNNSPWYLVSNNFTIQAATGIAAPSASSRHLGIDFHPATRNVDVTFATAALEPVLLQAFDPQGHLVATLLQGNYAAGSHALSIFSNRLPASTGTLIFKLQVGQDVETHTFMMVR